VRGVEPERELVRRALPFGPPAILLSFLVGALWGMDAAWSTAIGATVVLANFVANGLSVAAAARVSATVLMAVALGGFIVRLGTIAAMLAVLTKLDFFSPLAFALAVIPWTILLLAFEMKVLSGRLQADLWTTPTGPPGVER